MEEMLCKLWDIVLLIFHNKSACDVSSVEEHCVTLQCTSSMPFSVLQSRFREGDTVCVYRCVSVGVGVCGVV